MNWTGKWSFSEMAQTAEVIRWCWLNNISLEKSEALYQTQDIYAIMEEKVEYNIKKGKNREELIIPPILSLPHHILSGISTPLFSEKGLNMLNLTFSFSLMHLLPMFQP